MRISELLLPEYDNEIVIARRLLERVPDGDGKVEWKPHPSHSRWPMPRENAASAAVLPVDRLPNLGERPVLFRESRHEISGFPAAPTTGRLPGLVADEEGAMIAVAAATAAAARDSIE